MAAAAPLTSIHATAVASTSLLSPPQHTLAPPALVPPKVSASWTELKLAHAVIALGSLRGSAPRDNLRCMIRLCRTDDAAAVAAIYRPVVEHTAISFEVEPPSPVEMERRIAATLAFAPYLVFDDGAVAGYAYASRHRERAAYQWSVDVSLYVDVSRRRQGIGRALYQTLFTLLRLQGFRAAHAGITLPNAGSVGLHESLGFGPVGVYRKVGYKQGAWHDVGWWQLELGDRTGAPVPPRSFAEVQLDPRWRSAIRSACDERDPLLSDPVP